MPTLEYLVWGISILSNNVCCFSCRFFPLVLIYFIAGLLYNKIHKGVSSFPEMIPNHSFWGDVPFLVKVSLEFMVR